jgi:nickel-dependent lactate racemase
MENAARALRPGGVLVYFAECREGAGSAALEEWIERFSSSVEMEKELHSRFVVGAHKAFWLARLGERAKILLVSSLPDSFVRKCHLHPLTDATLAVNQELRRGGKQVAYIPHASLTLPVAVEKHVSLA